MNENQGRFADRHLSRTVAGTIDLRQTSSLALLERSIVPFLVRPLPGLRVFDPKTIKPLRAG
jgi:hypothetical protein